MHGILDAVKLSAAQVASRALHIKINREAIPVFVSETPAETLRGAEAVAYPLKFKSIADRVNFHVLAALLEFGSGFRHELHKYTHRGAHDTMAYGLLSAYIQTPGRLDARWMTSVSVHEVASLFGLPIDVDMPMMPAVYLSEPGPLKPLVNMICDTLNTTGTALLKHSYGDLAALVFDAIGEEEEEEGSAARIVLRLAEVIPAFDDRAAVDALSPSLRQAVVAVLRDPEQATEVLFMKKAQLAVGDLFKQLRGIEPRFDFADVASLSIFVDNVIPAVLRKLGILELSEDLAATIDGRDVIPHGDRRELELRACALTVCEEIVALYEGGVTAVDLDFFLWRLGKKEGFRSVKRHVTPDTVFY